MLIDATSNFISILLYLNLGKTDILTFRALTILWLIILPGCAAGNFSFGNTDTSFVKDNNTSFKESFPTDSLAIEQAAQTIFQKKVSKSNRYYRKLAATNASFLKKLKKQESRILAKLRTDSLKPAIPGLEKPGYG